MARTFCIYGPSRGGQYIERHWTIDGNDATQARHFTFHGARCLYVRVPYDCCVVYDILTGKNLTGKYENVGYAGMTYEETLIKMFGDS